MGIPGKQGHRRDQSGPEDVAEKEKIRKDKSAVSPLFRYREQGLSASAPLTFQAIIPC